MSSLKKSQVQEFKVKKNRVYNLEMEEKNIESIIQRCENVPAAVGI
jgi:hypothetical protein